MGRRARAPATACRSEAGSLRFSLPRAASERAHPGQRSDDFARRLPGEEQLPWWGMLQLDGLGPELELAAAARGQEDLSHWHLGRQAQGVGRRRAADDDGFAALAGPLLDHLGDLRCARAELAHDRQDIDAPTSAQQLTAAR